MALDSIPVSDGEALALSQAGLNDVADMASDNAIKRHELQKLSPERRAHLRSKLNTVPLSEATRGSMVALLNDLDKTNPIVAATAPARPVSMYNKGKDTKAVAKGEDFESIAGKDLDSLAMSVKRNISILHRKVQTDWIRHADDVLLGSDLSHPGTPLFRKDYEHMGRLVSEGLTHFGILAIDGENKGGNITSYSKDTASIIIDGLVEQSHSSTTVLTIGKQTIQFNSVAERNKAIQDMLIDMNDALVSEDSDWLLLATAPGVYIEAILLTRLLKATLTTPIKVKGVNINPTTWFWVGQHTVAFTQEMYEKLDRATKGVASSGKSLWQSTKDRASQMMSEGASDADLTEDQKKIKTAQEKGIKEVLKDYLFKKYGGGMTRQKFGEEMEGGIDASLTGARQELKALVGKMSKHLPLDLGLMDGYEMELKLREMALDMPMGAGKRAMNSLYRAIFENWFTDLIFARMSRGYELGSYHPQITSYANGISDRIYTSPVDLGGGESVDVPHARVKEIKQVIEHVNASVAQHAVGAEQILAREIATADAEINRLKRLWIPDNESTLNTLDHKLAEAKRLRAEYQRLFDDVDSKEKGVEDAEKEVKAKDKAVSDAKGVHASINEWWNINNDHEDAERKAWESKLKLDEAKASVERSIKTLESSLSGDKVVFTKFSVPTTDPNFSRLAADHITQLQDDVGAHNKKSKTKKIDVASTFSRVGQDLKALWEAQVTHTTTENDVTRKAKELTAKQKVLDTLGKWDPSTKRPSMEPRVAQEAIATAERELATANGEKDKADKALDRARAALGHMSGIKSEVEAHGKVRTDTEIDAKIKEVSDMRAALKGKTEKTADLATLRATREADVKRAGVLESDVTKLAPKPDGTLTMEGVKILREIADKAAASQGDFNAWRARVVASGLTVDIVDGKVEVKDSSGALKAKFDTRNPKDMAKMFKEYGRR